MRVIGWLLVVAYIVLAVDSFLHPVILTDVSFIPSTDVTNNFATIGGTGVFASLPTFLVPHDTTNPELGSGSPCPLAALAADDSLMLAPVCPSIGWGWGYQCYLNTSLLTSASL